MFGNGNVLIFKGNIYNGFCKLRLKFHKSCTIFNFGRIKYLNVINRKIKIVLKSILFYDNSMLFLKNRLF